MPEQIFRVWAYWRLDLNYYDAPPVDPEAYRVANTAWTTRRRDSGNLRLHEAGKAFPSFEGFAYYCLGVIECSRPDARETSPAGDFASLDKALSDYDLRNEFAHAVTVTRKRERDKFYKIIDTWLESMLASCPTSSTRGELLSIVEALPILDGQGNLISVG